MEPLHAPRRRERPTPSSRSAEKRNPRAGGPRRPGIPLEVALVPIEKLFPYERNPRKNLAAVEKVAQSIREFGFRQPIVVDRKMVVVAGHTRLLAAKQLGLAAVPVHVAADLTPEQARAYRIMDNRSADEAEWDEDLLRLELGDLRNASVELSLTGFDDDELDKLLAGEDLVDALEEGETPPAPKNPVTKPGDIWKLGDHRLACGDATDAALVRRAVAGAAADSMVTDPPYGVDYSSKNEMLNKVDKGNRVQKAIKNDALKDYSALNRGFLAAAPLAAINTVYVFISGRELHTLRAAAEAGGYTTSQYLVWVKNNHVLGRQGYQNKHEFILDGWRGVHRFYGSRSSMSVLEYDRPHRSELHPTMKPVALVGRLIADGSPRSGAIYDPFGGSGTTFVAAEQLERRAVTIEIDPAYCDVIVERWQGIAGGKAKREAA